MKKHCPRCNKDLPIEKFGKNKRTIDRLSIYCKECRNKYRKEDYKTGDYYGKRELIRKLLNMFK